MKYSDFIALVSREVRDLEAWPSDSSKVQEQVDRSYAAMLAVAQNTDLSNLSTALSSALAVSGSGLIKAVLPATTYFRRPDLGISFVEFDGAHTRMPNESIVYQSVVRSSSNAFQASNILFNVDPQSRCIWFTGATSVRINHFPVPAKPATGAVGSTDIFLAGNDVDEAVQIVAAHVNGVTVKSPSAAQFAIILSEMYGVAKDVQ